MNLKQSLDRFDLEGKNVNNEQSRMLRLSVQFSLKSQISLMMTLVTYAAENTWIVKLVLSIIALLHVLFKEALQR
jgi:hypothetical protein